MSARVLILLVFLSLAPLKAADFAINFDKLASSVAALNDGDRTAVTEATELIKRGENNLALARLSSLAERNPKNSSLRVLSAYVLLKTGDLLGAYKSAQQAEAMPDGSTYVCWFYGKLALLTGDKVACKRELKHIQGDKTLQAEVRELKKDLNAAR